MYSRRIFCKIASVFIALSLLFSAIAASNDGSSRTYKSCQLFDSNLSHEHHLDKLQWVPDNASLCGGHFRTDDVSFAPDFILDNADYLSLKSGTLVAKGHIKARKGKQAFHGDSITVKSKNNHAKEIILQGRATFFEQSQYIKANKVRYLPDSGYGEMHHVLYLLQSKPQAAWGKACMVKRPHAGLLKFTHASYTTCAPNHVYWQLRAGKIELNKTSSKGFAKDATFYVDDIPLFYAPYLSFPLDAKRKSGFLMPKFTRNSQSGAIFQWPYYLNLAPNYDVTLLPKYLQKRGLMFGAEFRYINSHSESLLDIDYLANDKAFKDFKSQNSTAYPSLLSLDNSRYAIRLQSNNHWENGAYAHINYQKVSDDYYFQDFQNRFRLTSNQLPQEFELGYNNIHWHLSALYGRYQTLHPFNESSLINIYTRSPKVSATGVYLDLPLHANFKLFTDIQHLDWDGANPNTTPEGLRANAYPILRFNWATSLGRFRPTFGLPLTSYSLSHYQNQNKSISRALLQSALDWQNVLYKSIDENHLQTLEPRLFYLYVPYQGQSDIPVFDSAYLQPSFNQLFRLNRFSGIDRIGDANHLSFGLTSRWLNDGHESLRLSLGGSYRFHDEHVTLCFDAANSACTDNETRLNYLSRQKGFIPMMAEGELGITDSLSVLANVAWDTKKKQLNNTLLNIHYEPQTNHIVNFSYGYLLNGDPINLSSGVFNNTNLSQIRLSYAWPLSIHWHALGAVAYNFSQHFSPMYFAGVEYDSCCVALRALAGRSYLSYTASGNPEFNQSVSLQVVFKGLANVESGRVSDIRTFMPSYVDQFHQGFKL